MTSNVILTVIYALAYIYSYIFYLNNYFEYLHFPYINKDLYLLILSLILAVLPSVFIGQIKNVGTVFSSFVFLLIYLPTILTLHLAYSGTYGELLIAQITFMICMILLFIASKFNHFKTRSIDSSNTNYFGYVLVFASFFSIALIIITYGEKLKFVNLNDVYIHRAENKHLESEGWIGYIMSWSRTFVIPALVVYSFMNRKFTYFILACIASIIMYMADGSKGSLLMPVIIFFLYQLIQKFGIQNLYRSSLITLIFIMIIGTSYVYIFGLNAPFTIIIAIVIMRVVATSGILNTIYYEFFQNNPSTYLSQYGFFNGVIIDYPYGEEMLGYIIGREYVFDGMNVNANFWAADGLLNAGLIGVVVISIVTSIFLVIINKLSRNSSLAMSSLLVLIFFSIAANASFIQALWSGGGLFMMLSFKYFKDRIDSFQIRKG
jgi:hypothetical protein